MPGVGGSLSSTSRGNQYEGRSVISPRAEGRRPPSAAEGGTHDQSHDQPDPLLLQRPDGVYWQAAEGEEAFGPFETYELARADFLRGDEERPAPGEGVDEAESELGLNTWVDEETGQVAEGQSPPHLQRP